MKKLLFIAMAAVAVTFTSCKNDTPAPTTGGEGEDTTATVVEYSPADSLKAAFEANDSSAFNKFLSEAQNKINELKETDPATAKKYLEAVQTFLKEKGDAIKTFVGTNTALATLIDNVNKLPEITVPDVVEGVKDAAENVKEDLKEGAEDLKEGAENLKDQATEKAEDVKNAVGDAAKDAQNKVEGAVDDAKAKTAEGIDKAANAAKSVIGK
ncbi:MAG: hypothetical protein IKH88_16620 [Prevotella sp.]|nr:hypothetical protein [Prevotella sp.]